jgi:hypothetical protein
VADSIKFEVENKCSGKGVHVRQFKWGLNILITDGNSLMN